MWTCGLISHLECSSCFAAAWKTCTVCILPWHVYGDTGINGSWGTLRVRPVYYRGFLSHSQSYRNIKHTGSQLRISAFKGITNSITFKPVWPSLCLGCFFIFPKVEGDHWPLSSKKKSIHNTLNEWDLIAMVEMILRLQLL